MKTIVSMLTASLVAALCVRSAELPDDPAFWRRIETLEPTPKGTGYLPGVESGSYVQFRFAVPKPRPPRFLLNLDNIVALAGGGTSYQVEIHVDSAAGPLLYKGAKVRVDHAFNAEDLSRLDATEFLNDTHLAQGHLDVWATAWVDGDLWTTYRDADGTRWDMYALVPEADAWERWEVRRKRNETALERGICVLPFPQRFQMHPHDFKAGKVRVELKGSDKAEDLATARQLREEIAALRIAVGNAGKRIALVLAPEATQLSDVVGFGVDDEIGDQGYVLDVRADGVVAAARTTVGLYYAGQTLQQLARRESGELVIPGVRIVDWPDLRYRMAQYDIARGNTVNVEYWKRWIRELSRVKINQIMLYMEDDWQSEKYPFLGRPDTFDARKAKELVAYARQVHVQLVPQVESLGHAGALLGHEELKDLRLGGNAGAICPAAERTLPFLDDLYEELAEAFPQSPLFHIGGDEVWGFADDPRCAEMARERGEEGVYAYHLNNLQQLLAKRGRTMAFWGDEVLNHPKVVDTLTREAVVFDWHYGNQKAYPSIKVFQDQGFRRIYVCPAVHGYFDVYPQIRQAFGNIRGFTQAGVEHGVEGACCTTWGMNRGGNAENYLYGLAYAAECAWSSTETDRSFFDSRFAGAWLGVRDAHGAAAAIDRAFWFTWRGELHRPFWQQLFRVSRFFFAPSEELAGRLTDEERGVLIREAGALQDLCREAVGAVADLRAQGARNGATLNALEHAIRIHDHVAGKLVALCGLANAYRTVYAKDASDRGTLEQTVVEALERLQRLRQEFPTLETGLAEGIRERGGDPNDMRMFVRARDSMEAYTGTLEAALRGMGAGGAVPTPSALGLGPRLLVKIGRWTATDVNPSDREHCRRITVDVTEYMTEPGRYEVEWDYTRGPDGLNIESTGLYEGQEATATAVAMDDHGAFTGAADHDNRYRLEVKAVRPGVRYCVVGKVYNQRDFDTNGDIWLRRDWR